MREEVKSDGRDGEVREAFSIKVSGSKIDDAKFVGIGYIPFVARSAPKFRIVREYQDFEEEKIRAKFRGVQIFKWFLLYFWFERMEEV